MIQRRFLQAVGVLAGCLFCFSGCGTHPPEIIQASGVVTLNGAPLNHAEVRFIPMQEGLSGNYVAFGTTNDEGKFTLEFPGNENGGVCVGEHRVIVDEGAAPGDAREDTPAGEQAWRAYKNSLKNRPIPRNYSSLSETPFVINVTKEQTEYNLELKR